MYYGQDECDRHIQEYFNGIEAGFAVEVGAAHGVAASNTLFFENLGWHVLCVEPNPDLYAHLARARKHTVHCACSNVTGIADFEVVRLVGGEVSAISSLRVDERLIETHSIESREMIQVPVRTLDQCLDDAGFHTLDLASIDTEGTELSVLEGFNIGWWKPRLIVVENNFEDPEIGEHLFRYGYVRDRRVGVNDFYISQYNNAVLKT